jgi:hypothetical protein
MNRTLIAAGIAAVAVFGAVYWFARPAAESPAPAAIGAEQTAPAAAATAAPAASDNAPAGPSRTDASGRPAPVDPRLAALVGAPGNPLVEYVADREGRVIVEINKDPSSARRGKPLREYTYRDGRLAGVVVYRPLGNQVQVVRADVTYKPDGSVDQFRENTTYEGGQ